jgi:hypothetical protein
MNYLITFSWFDPWFNEKKPIKRKDRNFLTRFAVNRLFFNIHQMFISPHAFVLL